MSYKQLTRGQSEDIRDIVRKHYPDAEWHAESSWNGKDEYIFNQYCGCYSEYTTEAASLTLFFKATVPEGRVNPHQSYKAECEIGRYAKDNLEHYGCECCGDSLFIDLRIFRAEKVAHE